MKLVTFETDGKKHLGAWIDDKIFDLHDCYSVYLTGLTPEKVKGMEYSALMKMQEKTFKEMPVDMVNFLKLGDEGMRRAEKIIKRMEGIADKDIFAGTVYSIDEVSLKAPLTWPGKILPLAGNYTEHIKEGGREVEGKEKMAPKIFMKPNTAIIGPNDNILLPRPGNKIDWEAELAVVMGKKCKYVKKEDAYDYVAGYTIMNDVSERELIVEANREPSEWNRFFDWLNGKWMDTFAPMGPCLVTKDEIEDPHDLSIKLSVNGEIKQNSNTGNMIFNIPEIIEFASRLITLEPGDIISTGTPSGVGSASGTFLKDGDIVEVEIEKIGLLKNTVKAEK